MSERALIYIPSEEIVSFVTNHPIDWMDRQRDFAKRGGAGDSAGATPTPAIEEFLNLLIEKRSLFTQREYMHHCWYKWEAWIRGLSSDQKVGVKAKLYRNFYPSAVDSLHVWAMLAETGSFEMCLMSATEDAIGKSDLILRSGSREVRLALQVQTRQSQDDRAYKMQHRGNDEAGCIEVWLDLKAPKFPGNKRWFKKTDVMSAIMSSVYQPTPTALLEAP